MNKHIILSFFLVSTVSISNAQDPLVLYDKQNPTAGIIYEASHKPKPSELPEVPAYPIEGTYSPTSYSNGPLGIDQNRGFCDYIYVPSKGKLVPGKQYTLKLRIKFDKSYDDMTFYQNNFGIALTSYLYPNKFPSHWGLWRHTNESLGIFHGGEEITIEQEFRPLCTSKYVVLGVFRAGGMDHLSCFFCYYPFEVYELSISESKNPEKACAYFGDAFKQEVEDNFEKKEYSVYFESGSSEITAPYLSMLDSISTRLKTTNELVLLSAHTDMSGSNNVKLGAARNESVKKALTSQGVDHSSIKNYNFADDEAAAVILSTDRRVEISLVKGDLFRKHYSDALMAAKEGDFPTAHKIMHTDWLKSIQPKKAIGAYFDNWGNDEKVVTFKNQLLKAIKSKFYRKKELIFTLDSLRYEWLKGRSLTAHLTMLRMPSTDHNCSFSIDNVRDSLLRKAADAIFEEEGFPQRTKVGHRASTIIPEIILTSQNASYLGEYLPRFRKACEERKLSWPFYARLFDKISIIKNGFQLYGTQIRWDGKGNPIPLFPFEDPAKVDEYRRQVKLTPFTKPQSSEVKSSQDKLDKELVSLLNNVYKADQHHRNSIDERDRDFKKWAATDSINQVKVKKILDERGWLGPEVVGKRGSTAIFLVIQHADLETQLKYLPIMRTSVTSRAKTNLWKPNL